MNADLHRPRRIDPVGILALALAAAATISIWQTARTEGLVGHLGVLLRCVPALVLGGWSLRRTTRRRRRWRGLPLPLIAIAVALIPVELVLLGAVLLGLVAGLSAGMQAD